MEDGFKEMYQEDETILKKERFEEFLSRLMKAPNAKSQEEAYGQIWNILNEVENQLTDIPYNPDNWQTDGRLYPPHLDNIRSVPEKPFVKRLRSLAHNTFLGENGSIEIQETVSKRVVLSKAGEDGRGVWEL